MSEHDYEIQKIMLECRIAEYEAQLSNLEYEYQKSQNIFGKFLN